MLSWRDIGEKLSRSRLDHVIHHIRKLALFLVNVRVRIFAYALVRDWVRVKVGIELKG